MTWTVAWWCRWSPRLVTRSNWSSAGTHSRLSSTWRTPEASSPPPRVKTPCPAGSRRRCRHKRSWWWTQETFFKTSRYMSGLTEDVKTRYGRMSKSHWLWSADTKAWVFCILDIIYSIEYQNRLEYLLIEVRIYMISWLQWKFSKQARRKRSGGSVILTYGGVRWVYRRKWNRDIFTLNIHVYTAV